MCWWSLVAAHDIKEVLHRAPDPGVPFGFTPPQNQNPDFSLVRFFQSDLSSRNETLDHCRHFPLSDSKIHSIVDEKTYDENENISSSGQIGKFYIVNLRAYLELCGGPL